jgi:hypothetical protein
MNTQEKLNQIDDLIAKALYHSEAPRAVELLGLARAAIKEMRPKPYQDVQCDHTEY